MKKIVFILLLSLTFAQEENSIVKIYSTFSSPYLLTPWSPNSPQSSHGTGFIIENNRILTNAHVVEYATHIQVKKNGEVKRYSAYVEFVSHQVDLALLKIDDSTFFNETVPLEFGEIPKIQEEIIVGGYPVGGEEIAYSLGIVSRIEVLRYSHSLEGFLMIQVDAAINSGNSGGPAFLSSQVIGVATQSSKSGENIGYLIPVPIIMHFLEDIDDGMVDGFPQPPFRVQEMENPMMRDYFQMENFSDDGVLVYSVNYDGKETTNLRIGDILLEIDGQKMYYNSKVKVDGKLYHFSYLVSKHQIGDKISYVIKRDGEKKTIWEKAIRPTPLVAFRCHESKPTYFVYGGFVFSVLNRDYFAYLSYTPSKMGSFRSLPRTEEQNEIVILQDILTDNFNIGYWKNDVVSRINEKPIRNLKEFIEQIEMEERWINLEFMDHSTMIIDKKKADLRHEEILKLYSISHDRSEDLR